MAATGGARPLRAAYLSVGVIVVYWAFSIVRHAAGPHPVPDGVAYVAVFALSHAIVALAVVSGLLAVGGESPAVLGFRWDRSGRGLGLLVLYSLGLFVVANVFLNSLLSAWLGGGAESPLATLFRDPREAPLWVLAAVAGGGFAEELERAFVLTRFEKVFGRPGLVLAVAVDVLVFGLGHLYQGVAGAVTSGFMGLAFALIFLRRRRVIDAMIVHSAFDLLGVAAAYALYSSR
jgi:membrane protease YdiL (CAAX protease family)